MGIGDTEDSGARFSPPPYAVVVEDGSGQAQLIVLAAEPGWHRWLAATFQVDRQGATVSCDLESHTEPEEAAKHVCVHNFAGKSGQTRHALLRRGLMALYPGANEPRSDVPDWWLRPIYCGWGDQATTSMWLEGIGPQQRGLAFCIQGLYERWVDRLDQAEVPVGTIIIDAGWSPAGWWKPDRERWPDLRGFVDRQHERGRKVLLWLATWLHDGLPDEWCVFDRGYRLTCDPSHPDYRAHARACIHELLSPDGYDADGFKIDQLTYCPSQRSPCGGLRFGDCEYRAATDEPLQLAGGPDAPWGCELLYEHQKDMYTAAKAAKPDCLVTSSTVHPYFHDTFDMTRLHDTGPVEGDPIIAMAARAELSRAALPHKPIDSDDWITQDYQLWMRYTTQSHALGVPCTFYAERFVANWQQEPATTPIPLADLRRIGDAWRAQGY